jgi:PAS domain S-box-containing protein
LRRNYPVGALVLEKSRDAAEVLVNALRRTGLSLRPRWVNRPGMLAELLRGQRWDLLLVGLGDPVDSPAQVLDVVRRSESDVALIGIVGTLGNDMSIEEALRAGFHDVVSLDRDSRLQHVVTRELESLEQRRQVRRLNARVKASTRTLRELIRASERPMAVVHGGQILEANLVWMDLMGISPGEDLRGRPISDYVAEEDRDAFSRVLAEQARAPDPVVEIDLMGLRADGESIPLSLDIVSGTFEERAGLLITVREPAPVVSAQGRPEPGAVARDRRASLLQVVDAARKEAAGGALACILIENQQKLGEVLGLAGRDRLAGVLLERIREQAGSEAVVDRIGDDTYGIFIPGIDMPEMRDKSLQIASAISRAVVGIGKHSVRPACLAGAAPVSGAYPGGMAVLEAAYADCRRPVMPRPAPPRALSRETAMRYEELAGDLADAMSDGRLSMVFQPIVCLRSEPIELYEVFIRLVDRRGGAVPSRAVIAAARQKDLDIDLDLWVIERAIRIIESRAGQGRNTHLFINLSERCMDDIRIPLRISRELKARNVPARNLIIQLSEIAASGNLNKSHAFVESLHKIGCSTALDHFGLSLSAFQLLEDVSVEYLKLDESIVNRVAEDAEAYSQVAEICRRARKLEKQTIASYLDNPRSLSKLFDAGVDFVQGYYIHEPSDSMDFEFSILLES